MRRLMALILCAALLCALCPALAQENAVMESGGFQYVVMEDGTAKIVGYTGDKNLIRNRSQTYEIYFPNRLVGHTVTAIGDEVSEDYFCADSVYIPETIVSIGSKALNLIQVENIFVYPGNPVYESVGGVLYDKTKKTLHSYPGGRRSDRYSVRKGTASVGEYAFYGCYGLKTVELPKGLTEIGDSAFAHCYNLTDAILPQSLLRIGENAFTHCQSLREAEIPANAGDIGAAAFSMCKSLEAFSVAQDNSVYTSADGVLFSENGKRLHAYPGNRKDAEYTVPESVEMISREAFAGSVHLAKAVIPAGVKSIDAAVFAGCESLTELEVMEGNLAYHDENGVLFGTDSRRLKAYPAGRKDTAYVIPAGTLAIDEAAFSYCVYLKDIVIPDSVLALDDGAFYRCHGLGKIILPSGITDIGPHTFAECYSLRSVTLPTGLKEIGESAFYGCYNLNGIVLPDGLQSIGRMAFGWCGELMGVFVPASVTMIEKDTFFVCEQLMLEVVFGSYGHTYAQANNLAHAFHPNWLK